MKISNAARLIFWLAAIFAIGILVRAESGQRSASAPNKMRAPSLRIVDQYGQPAVSGIASPTGTTVDVAVGQGGDVFVPDTVNISVGDTVRWTWATSGHSVTSGPPCVADSQYCSPNDTNCFPGTTSNQGFVYTHTFTEPGTYAYYCIVHCVIGMTGVVNVSGVACSPSGWSAGPDLSSPGTRFAGVYFQPNGKFYAMGGRSADASGAEFVHPFEYDPVANSWTTKSASYPDTKVNNMVCGVLADAGTPYIYCVGGTQYDPTTLFVTGRVFRYDPIADVITTVTGADWPPGVDSLPGGFSIFSNKLYTLGTFQNPGQPTGTSTNQIWQFTPDPAGWVQKTSVLPVPLAYVPATTIGSLIYTGGGASITAGVLTDEQNSFVYNPVADSISTIANIPRATSNTRGLNFNDQMYVMGGAFTTISNEVDIYDPVSNSWSLGQPFVTARRNFATDTDGTSRIWLVGGYDSTLTILSSMEKFCFAAPTPTPTPTATPTATATATATATSSPTATPPGTRATPTPRPRPTPVPRP